MTFQDEGEGISLGDYYRIFQVLAHIEDIDKALTFHHMAGSPIGPSTLTHVAQVSSPSTTWQAHLLVPQLSPM